jgi:hypothetical protein
VQIVVETEAIEPRSLTARDEDAKPAGSKKRRRRQDESTDEWSAFAAQLDEITGVRTAKRPEN